MDFTTTRIIIITIFWWFIPENNKPNDQIKVSHDKLQCFVRFRLDDMELQIPNSWRDEQSKMQQGEQQQRPNQKC